MKNIAKKLLLGMAILSLVLTMASCNNFFAHQQQTQTQNPDITANPDKTTTPEETTPEETTTPEDIVDPEEALKEKKEFCKELSALIEKKHETIRLNITTQTGGSILCSTFVMNKTEVTYHIEKLASFKFDDDGNVIPPKDYKETFKGTVVLGDNTDGVIVDGEFVLISDYDLLAGNFNFVAENVGDYQKEQSGDKKQVSFEVLNASEFLGTQIDGVENMTVSVSYSKAGISAITIQYATKNAEVKMDYYFS